jgi:hypothetical protein
MTVTKSHGPTRALIAGIATLAILSFSGVAAADSLTSAAADVAPPSGVITLDVVTVNGSGCPAGTASVRMLPDNTGFRIFYTDFIARDGAGIAPTEFRQNCQVNVVVHSPQGYTFAVASASYRGRASLRNGATALHRTNYYFQGSADNNVVDHRFSGPLSGTWYTLNAAPVEELVYAPCGEDKNLNINTELRVDSPTGVSWMSLRASEAEVNTIVNFSWLSC